jgi:hypothetical protein
MPANKQAHGIAWAAEYPDQYRAALSRIVAALREAWPKAMTTKQLMIAAHVTGGEVTAALAKCPRTIVNVAEGRSTTTRKITLHPSMHDADAEQERKNKAAAQRVLRILFEEGKL